MTKRRKIEARRRAAQRVHVTRRTFVLGILGIALAGGLYRYQAQAISEAWAGRRLNLLAENSQGASRKSAGIRRAAAASSARLFDEARSERDELDSSRRQVLVDKLAEVAEVRKLLRDVEADIPREPRAIPDDMLADVSSDGGAQ